MSLRALPRDFFRHVPVLVTGGAGFIGSHLVDALAGLGARVTILDSLATGRAANLAAHFTAGDLDAIEGAAAAGDMPRLFVSSIAPPVPYPLALLLGDIRLPDHCRLAAGLEPSRLLLQKPAFVFHQAALGSVPRSVEDPSTTLAVNAGGTANVFSVARQAGVRRVIYASSSSVYGDSETLPKREGDEGEPLSPYAYSKVANEHLARVFGRCYGMEAVGLRYFNVYGPRQNPSGPYAAVIPRFFRAGLEGKPAAIFGDGEQSRDFTYVADAVASNLLAASAPAAACGRAYNVAGGMRITVNDLARAIRDIAGAAPDPVHVPDRPGDVRHSLADLSLVQANLGYAPSRSLEEGLVETFAHFRSQERSLSAGAT